MKEHPGHDERGEWAYRLPNSVRYSFADFLPLPTNVIAALMVLSVVAQTRLAKDPR